MTDEARIARNEYYKEWRKNNKEKVRQQNRNYWDKRIQKLKNQDVKIAQ